MAAAFQTQLARKLQCAGVAAHRQNSLAEANTGSAFAWLVTMLCIGLLLVCGTVQVSHVHLHLGAATDAECSLCVVAHLDLHPAVAAILVAQSTGAERCFTRVPSTVCLEPLASADRIRPPPALVSIAW